MFPIREGLRGASSSRTACHNRRPFDLFVGGSIAVRYSGYPVVTLPPIEGFEFVEEAVAAPGWIATMAGRLATALPMGALRRPASKRREAAQGASGGKWLLPIRPATARRPWQNSPQKT